MEFILASLVFGALISACFDTTKPPAPKSSEDKLGESLSKYLADTQKELKAIKEAIEKK